MKLCLIIISFFVLGNILGQENDNNRIFLREKKSYYLGVGIGFSVYHKNYLNTHFKTDEDTYKYGFDVGLVHSIDGNIFMNIVLSQKLDLSSYFQASRGRIFDILGTNEKRFAIYSLGCDLKRYFPFGSGRHSIFAAIGAKMSLYDFMGYRTYNEGVKLKSGLSLQAESFMFQPFVAVDIARKMHDSDITILPPMKFADFLIGIDLYF